MDDLYTPASRKKNKTPTKQKDSFQNELQSKISDRRSRGLGVGGTPATTASERDDDSEDDGLGSDDGKYILRPSQPASQARFKICWCWSKG